MSLKTVILLSLVISSKFNLWISSSDTKFIISSNFSMSTFIFLWISIVSSPMTAFFISSFKADLFKSLEHIISLGCMLLFIYEFIFSISLPTEIISYSAFPLSLILFIIKVNISIHLNRVLIIFASIPTNPFFIIASISSIL